MWYVSVIDLICLNSNTAPGSISFYGSLKKEKTFLGNNRDLGGDWKEGDLQSEFNEYLQIYGQTQTLKR